MDVLIFAADVIRNYHFSLDGNVVTEIATDIFGRVKSIKKKRTKDFVGDLPKKTVQMYFILAF